jgi:hypothetical protein
MRTTLKLLISAVLLISLFVMAIGCSAGPSKSEIHLLSISDNIQAEAQWRLMDLDTTLSQAAVKIAKSGLTGDETRATLEAICQKYPFLVDCATADNGGTMRTLAPEAARQYEGINTSKNKVSTEFAQDQDPLLSNSFMAVQGFDAVVLVLPVHDEKGKLLGSVSALFKPEGLFDDIIMHWAKPEGIKVNVMQLDGLVIYCSTGTETGKNVLTDPSYKGYPELIAQAARIAKEPEGSGSYTYPDEAGQVVKKFVVWDSVGLHGNAWRVVLITEPGK